MKRISLRLFPSALLAIAIWVSLLVPACSTTKLEPGGAYAPAGTNGVAVVAPDYAFFIADSSFDLAYSALDAAFTFERDNRALLWNVSHKIKHTLDQLRPQALTVRNQYIAARVAYIANPTPAGLSTLQTALAKIKQLSAAAQAALPK